ncbi:MAG: 50S ribosomal protein L6 [candidate division NC10 bacterium RIFCSPLOWO2_12_FULL_66_18]|nr:MAG: 50S ribosomal protein L6 [candidate division NC10 bacterium RIFCSPLOWO2_02_FULL_66_22]OGB96596.1 MAG: 50S ribosomal protein L6 [candidate division NC10 bacterium RIFCSPLOWO2_12_FULL_66_18]
MSRIGKLPISIPDTVKVELQDHTVSVKGPKGTLSMVVHPAMDVRVQDRQVLCGRPSDTKFHKALHGLTRSLIANMVEGVTKGFERKLELVGVGYRAAVQGQNLTMTLGYSHPIIYPIPQGIRIEVKDQTQLMVSGTDKQLVGAVAAKVRSFRPPEPYKGKGVKYADERIRRKAGKTGAK